MPYLSIIENCISTKPISINKLFVNWMDGKILGHVADVTVN